MSQQRASHARRAKLRADLKVRATGAMCSLLVLGASAHAQTAESALLAKSPPPLTYAPLALDAPFGSLNSTRSAYSPSDALDRGALSYFRKVDGNDLHLSSFVASRAAQDTANYRVYVGVGYKQDLTSFAKFTGGTFYGAGTYDGNNADGRALPEEVRSAGSPAGAWLGSNWQLESKLFEKHTFSAGMEYRQQVEMPLMEITQTLARKDDLAVAQPMRKLGFVTRSRLALSSATALNVRARLDDVPTSRATPFVADQQQSLEIGMEHSGPGGKRAQLSYAWQRANDSTSTSNARVGQHLTKLRMDIPSFSTRLQTGFELQYLAPLDTAGDRDYLIGNFTLAGRDLKNRTRVTVGFNNLFGAKQIESGRSVRLDLVRKL